jgi:hypothetical protein
MTNPNDPGWYDRPPAYIGDDDVLHLRASSIGGGCAMRQALAAIHNDPGLAPSVKLDGPAPFPPQLQAAMEESSALEQQAFDLLWDEAIGKLAAKDEWSVGEEAEWVQLELGDHAIIDGTTDYSVIDPVGQVSTVEIKCVGSKLFEELRDSFTKPWEQLTGLPLKYRHQVAVYAHALDRPCWLAVCEKANGALTGQVVWYPYHPDSHRLLPRPTHFATTAVQIREQIHEINVSGKTTCPTADSTCPWADVCQKPTVIRDAEFVDTAENYATAQAAAKVAAAIADELKHKLGAWAEAHGGRIASPYGHKVTVTESAIPERTVKPHTRTTIRITQPKDKDKKA